MGYSKITALSLTDLFVQQIENMILSGELAFGEQLPPARELAAKMGVSRTVVTAGLGLGNSRQKYLYVPEPQGFWCLRITQAGSSNSRTRFQAASASR